MHYKYQIHGTEITKKEILSLEDSSKADFKLQNCRNLQLAASDWCQKLQIWRLKMYLINRIAYFFKENYKVTCSSVFAVMTFCFFFSPSYAETYYVAPFGDDTNPGSESKPFRTLQKAANLTLPGDTVVAKDGVYTSLTDSILNITRTGSSDAWITFKSENLYGAILDGRGYATSYGILLLETAAYIRIEGFKIHSTRLMGIYGFSNPTLKISTHDVIIKNNNIYDIGRVTISDCNDSYGRAGIFVNQLTRNYTFEENVIHDIGRLPDSCQEHAYRHDHGMYLQGKYMTVNNNIFYNNASGWAIKIDGYYSDDYIAENENSHVITNNSFSPTVHAGAFIRFFNNLSYTQNYGQSKSPENILIENNRFYKPSGTNYNTAIAITDDINSNFKGTIIKNNITTSDYMFPDSPNIKSNITDINNTVKASDSLFYAPFIQSIK